MTASEWGGVGVGIIVGGIFTLVISHFYYRRSLRDLKTAFATQLTDLRQVYEAQLEKFAQTNIAAAKEAAGVELWNKRLQSAIDEHRRRGTAQLLIDSYGDYSRPQKAQLWEAVGKAIRGPAGFRTNPFR
jgi:hypothetical protein